MKKMRSLIRKDRKLLLSFLFSIAVSLVLTIYNACLGLINHAIWNGYVSIYYCLLLLIRTTIFIEEYYRMKKGTLISKRAFLLTSILMIILTLSLIGVAVLMIKRQKQVTISTVPSIIMAVLTTYKVIAAIKKYIDFRKDENLFTRQIMMINLISAGVTLLTLQNTLIVVHGEFDESMVILSIASSVGVLITLGVLSIISLVKGLNEIKKKEQA